MADPGYRIREFRPSDYADEARILTALDPASPVSKEEMRRFEELFFTPPYALYKIVAESVETGRPVGFASLRSDPESYDSTSFWVGLAVDAGHEARGVGRALADRLDEEADRRHATRLWAGVFADQPRALRFFARQGFVEKRRGWKSRLDLTRATPLADRREILAKAGVDFLTAAELDLTDPSVLRRLYELNHALSADEPRLAPYTPVTFEQFAGSEISGPQFLADAFFLARANGRFIGVSALRRNMEDPESLHQSFTGTLAEFRGRGIATELKRRAVDYAVQHGYRTITTRNDSLNEPMLAINRKLGFERERERIVGERRQP